MCFMYNNMLKVQFFGNRTSKCRWCCCCYCCISVSQPFCCRGACDFVENTNDYLHNIRCSISISLDNLCFWKFNWYDCVRIVYTNNYAHMRVIRARQTCASNSYNGSGGGDGDDGGGDNNNNKNGTITLHYPIMDW